MEDSNMHELVTVAAPAMAMGTWCSRSIMGVGKLYLENVWYKFKNWIMKKVRRLLWK